MILAGEYNRNLKALVKPSVQVCGLMEGWLQSTPAPSHPGLSPILTLAGKFREWLLPGHPILTERQEAQKRTPSLCSESSSLALSASPLSGSALVQCPAFECSSAGLSSHARKMSSETSPTHCPTNAHSTRHFPSFGCVCSGGGQVLAFQQLILTERTKAIVLPAKQPHSRSCPPT